MSAPNLGDIVASAWEHTLRVSPDPFRNLSRALFGLPPLSYRDDLHRPLVNHYGVIIPRIVLVAQNIRSLGDPHLPARRLPA